MLSTLQKKCNSQGPSEVKGNLCSKYREGGTGKHDERRECCGHHLPLPKDLLGKHREALAERNHSIMSTRLDYNGRACHIFFQQKWTLASSFLSHPFSNKAKVQLCSNVSLCFGGFSISILKCIFQCNPREHIVQGQGSPHPTRTFGVHINNCQPENKVG